MDVNAGYSKTKCRSSPMPVRHNWQSQADREWCDGGHFNRKIMRADAKAL